MKIQRFLFFFIALAVSTLFDAKFSWADTIYAQDGRVWQGLVIGENTQQVQLDLGFDVAKLDKKKIIRIERSNPIEAAIILKNLQIRRKNRDQILRARDGKPQEISLINEQGHVFVDALLNGHVKARLLLDTGSTLTFLSSPVANQAGLFGGSSQQTGEVTTSDGGKHQMVLGILKSIRVGTIEARDVEVAILPRKTTEALSLDGLLGVSFLSRFNFKIDYQRNKLILEPYNVYRLPRSQVQI